MKYMRKIFALVLAVIMVMSLATTAFAATTGSVKNDTNRTYNAYQIFSGTQAADSAVLGDIAWGTGINPQTFLAALKALTVDEDTPFANCTDAASVAEALKGVSDRSETAQAFANLAAKHLTSEATSVAANDTATLPSGYYLLVDTSSNNDAQNPALLQVTNDTQLNITDKSGAPSVDKTIKDEDDAAEGSIGDTFTFVLTATMPTTFEGYDSYKVVFKDTLSAGLTYANSLTVKVNGVDKTSAFTVSQSGTSLTVSCDNVLAQGAVAGCTIVVEYKATLNSNAVVGSAGNPNTVKLEYSNDPNWDGEGTEPTKETPEDKVVVFTFELDVTKIDGATQDTLEGAQFVLLNSDETKVATVVDGKLTGWVNVPAENADGSITWPDNTTLTSDDEGLFAIAGLDQGTYYLKETKAPAGYNLLKDPITIVITATVTDTEEKQELTALAITANSENGTSNVTNGTVGITVENNSGATLPETGGMGTTLFYVFGAILMVGAAVLLVTKRRMNMAE